MAELERRLAAAERAADQASRRQRYDAAETQANAARRRLQEYEALARKIVEIVRETAVAQIAVDAANVALPDGAELIEPVERLTIAGLPRKVLDERELSRWCHFGTTMQIPEEMQEHVQIPKVGRAYCAPIGAQSSGHFEVEKHTFVRREILPATSGETEGPIAQRLCLPGIYDWSDLSPYGAASTSLEIVNAAQAALKPKPPTQRATQIEMAYIPTKKVEA